MLSRVLRQVSEQERDRDVADDEGESGGHAVGRCRVPGQLAELRSSNSPDSTTAGMESRNENRAAARAVEARGRGPAVMVAPDRDTPGMSAKRLGHADQDAVVRSSDSMPRLRRPEPVGQRQDERRTR